MTFCIKLIDMNSNILKRSLPLIILFPFFTSCYQEKIIDFSTYTVEPWERDSINSEDLAKWEVLGNGKAYEIMNDQFYIGENEGSKGVMLVSPKIYDDVVLKYKVLALTASTVFVTALSTSSDSLNSELEFPSDYDGGISLLTEDLSNYFFAYKTTTHGTNPFITKNPHSQFEIIASDADNMIPGVYYNIEIGKDGKQLWLSINGKKVVEAEDEDRLKDGHIVFRLRGTSGLDASALIKDLIILTK